MVVTGQHGGGSPTIFSERLPSIDTRPPRMRDSDAIIEIVLQRSPSPDPEDVSSKDNKKDEIGLEGDRFDKPQSYNNGGKREVTRERLPHFSESEVEDHKHSPSSSRLTLGSAEYGGLVPITNYIHPLQITRVRNLESSCYFTKTRIYN